MSRKSSLRLLLLACTLLGTATAVRATLHGDEDEIETVMKKMHHKRNGIIPKIETAVKAEKWTDAEGTLKDLKKYGAALSKIDCPKGDKESWKKLTEAYKDNSVSLIEAIEKKDAEKAKKALSKFSKSCETCHDAHK